MSKLEKQWRHVAVLVVSATTAGCSVFSDDAQSEWRTSTLISVQPRVQLSTYVDARCVGAASVAPSEDVAVVKYRVGRAPYLQAFAIPSGRSLHKGDTVVVHPSQCLIKDAANAA